MKSENALSTERQPSAEELIAAGVCSTEFTDDQLEMARMVRQFGSAKPVRVTLDADNLINLE